MLGRGLLARPRERGEWGCHPLNELVMMSTIAFRFMKLLSLPVLKSP